jgi:peptidoglycan-associated lipoprotein
MSGRSQPAILFLVPMLLASLLLAGCPKRPAPATGVGATPSPSVSAGTGPGGAGSETGAFGGTPGTIGAGPGGVGSPGGSGSTAGVSPGGAGAPGSAGPGGASATGTTIPALPAPKEFVETPALRDVHFDFDRYEIRPQDKEILKGNAEWLTANPRALLLIEGHADERGTNEYNLALGERRAKATRDYLVSLGIDAARITLISYGEERPLCTERTEACWARNRRAHFLVKQ